MLELDPRRCGALLDEPERQELKGRRQGNIATDQSVRVTDITRKEIRIPYRTDIDGLRAIAVLLVVFFHADFPGFGGGFVGVDVFLVISGFLITSLIEAEMKARAFSVSGFLERRARRILPALFTVLMASIPAAWYLLIPDQLNDYAQSLIAITTFVSNIFFFTKSGYFDTPAEYVPLLHAWSLSLEEQFYLIFPLFFILVRRCRTNTTFLIFLVGAAISFMGAAWGVVNMPAAAFYLLPMRVWEFLIGAMVALYGNKIPGAPDKINWRCTSLALVGLGLICASGVLFSAQTPFPGVHALIPTIGTALILLFADGTRLGKALSHPLLVKLGLVSYGLYLWHYPLFVFYRHAQLDTPDPIVFVVLIMVSLFLASATWFFVEQPIRKRTVLKGKKFIYSAGICAVMLVAIGGVGQVPGWQPRSLVDQRGADILKEMEALFWQRQKAAKIGICQFRPPGTNDIDPFLKQWDCKYDKENPMLKQIPVIVTGDSVSADKVMALKQNGVVPLQIGGGNCSLTPSLMTKACIKVFEKIRQIVKEDTYFQYIAIAGRFDGEGESSFENIVAAIKYWKQFGKKLIFFTAMPEYHDLKATLYRGATPKIDLSPAIESSRKEVLDFMKAEGVHIVDTAGIFCKIAPGCGYRDRDGNMILSDDVHLSLYGARLFGKYLLEEDEVFSRWRQAGN